MGVWQRLGSQARDGVAGAGSGPGVSSANLGLALLVFVIPRACVRVDSRRPLNTSRVRKRVLGFLSGERERRVEGPSRSGEGMTLFSEDTWVEQRLSFQLGQGTSEGKSWYGEGREGCS